MARDRGDEFDGLVSDEELAAMVRPLGFYSQGEPVVADVPDDDDATIISRYHHALKQWKSGLVDFTVFDPFVGVIVGGYELETDPEALFDLARRGLLAPEDIYLLR